MQGGRGSGAAVVAGGGGTIADAVTVALGAGRGGACGRCGLAEADAGADALGSTVALTLGAALAEAAALWVGEVGVVTVGTPWAPAEVEAATGSAGAPLASSGDAESDDAVPVEAPLQKNNAATAAASRAPTPMPAPSSPMRLREDLVAAKFFSAVCPSCSGAPSDLRSLPKVSTPSERGLGTEGGAGMTAE